MSRPVFDKGDEGEKAALFLAGDFGDYLKERPDHVEIPLLISDTDVINFTGLCMVKYQIHCLVVVVIMDPITNIREMPVHLYTGHILPARFLPARGTAGQAYLSPAWPYPRIYR